jgi:hypothetical protein
MAKNVKENVYQDVTKYSEFAVLYVDKFIIFLFKSWATQNFITIKTSWNTND